MELSRRDSMKIVGGIVAATLFPGALPAQDLTTDPLPPRMPLDEFVQDQGLMDSLRRGVRAMKARKPSDPLSWFYQAAIHGATVELIQKAANDDPKVITVDQNKYWNQCPHSRQASANFLPWHRAYTHYFERILRAHTQNPLFALPYWDYSKEDYRRFPREFGKEMLDAELDGKKDNPLYRAIVKCCV